VAGRLLLVLPVPARGGAEDYALTIGRAAIARGWTVHAALQFAPATVGLRDDLEAAGIATAALSCVDRLARDDPEPPARAKLGAAARFARLVRRFRPDVVHVILPWPTFAYPFLLTSALLGVPTLTTFQLVPDDGLYVRRRRRLLYAWMRRRGQRLLAVSEHARRLVADLYRMDPGEIGVIRNGTSVVAGPNGGPPRSAKRTSLLRELGLPDEVTILLSLGRLHPQKGHVDLLCAAAGVHAERPDVRLLVAGDGPERQRLEQLVRALGLEDVVLLLGRRDDTDRLLDVADLFVLPSHFEGTPFAMLEAMAHGLPVVAAAFGGVEEIVDNGRTGVICPVGRPDALRAAISGALSDRERMRHLAAAGRERVAGMTEEAMVAATLEELEGLHAS
jgi:glycosyltransferase involved in cell wall biosynthesis